MINVLEPFREKLDEIMHRCMDKRVVVYGYGYSGKFIAWYAQYYHGIKPDYIITQDWSSAIPYEFELYRDTLFDFNYKDVKDSIVWLCLPETEEIRNRLESHGYVKGITYYNFGECIYGTSAANVNFAEEIQFMRWLEQEYGCDLTTSVATADFGNSIQGMKHYCISTQKEIFPILDRCHCMPKGDDAILDFGCGKGGAMLSFLDYGFENVGGVEYEDGLYNTLITNFKKIGIDTTDGKVRCIHGDAMELKEELDEYNWFYFFDPFYLNIFEPVINNICESLDRKPRKVHILYINPTFRDVILNTGKFVLTNQFTIQTRQRVVNVFVTKK